MTLSVEQDLKQQVRPLLQEDQIAPQQGFVEDGIKSKAQTQLG